MGDKLRTFSFKTGFKKARKNSGYTQKSFAEEFNISIETVKNWEQGRNVPEIETIENLCNFFKCDIDYLLGNIDCTTHDIQFIHDKTGLSEDAINSLIGQKELYELFGMQNDKMDIINLILLDNHKKTSLSSTLDLITGFCRFNISSDENKAYTVDQRGITPFQGHKTISGKGFSYNPMQAHFHLEDMESMYYLKIWDSIKDLKEMYNKSKIPDTN